VVSTNVGDIPDLVGDSVAALLVNPHDCGQLAVNIEELPSDDQLAARTLLAVRRVAKNFSWKAVRICLLQVYYPSNPAVPTVGSEPS